VFIRQVMIAAKRRRRDNAFFKKKGGQTRCPQGRGLRLGKGEWVSASRNDKSLGRETPFQFMLKKKALGRRAIPLWEEKGNLNRTTSRKRKRARDLP